MREGEEIRFAGYPWRILGVSGGEKGMRRVYLQCLQPDFVCGLDVPDALLFLDRELARKEAEGDEAVACHLTDQGYHWLSQHPPGGHRYQAHLHRLSGDHFPPLSVQAPLQEAP
jgi:hypothetical protein